MRQVAALGLAAVVLGAGLLIQPALAVLAEARQVWRGHYTLLVPEATGPAPGSAAAQVAQRLRAAGFDAVVAAETARERVTTFGGYEWVAVAELAARLDPLDPRYDPYLQRVGEWFAAETRAGAAALVYVASSLPPGYFAARVGWALRGAGLRWRLADLPWPEAALALLLFGAGAALQLGRGAAGARRWRLLLALPWLPLLAHGALPAAFVALPAHYLACAALAPQRGGSGVPAALAAVLFGMVALGLLRPEQPPAAAPWLALLPGRGLWRAAVYLLTGGAWSAALVGAGLLAVSGARPRSTGGGVGGWGAPAPRLGRPRRTGVGASVAVALTGAALVLTAGRGEPLPRPLPVAAGAGFRLADLPALDAAGALGLPALSHYAAHAAYQETLQYGRPFRLPEPEEWVTVDHYVRGGDGRVQHAAVAVAHFSDRWLQAALAAAPRASVPALLRAQGRPVAARRGPPPAPPAGAAPAWLLLTLLLAGAMLGPRRRHHRHHHRSGP